MLTAIDMRGTLSAFILLLIAAVPVLAIPTTGDPRAVKQNRQGLSPNPVVHLQSVPVKTLPTPPPAASPEHPAKGILLVASPNLKDPNFARTVVLLVDYSDEGALGIVINRPTDLELNRVLPEVEALNGHSDIVYLGGPVSRQRILILVRTRTAPPGALRLFEDLYVSDALETLEMAARLREQDAGFRAYAGYAGWGPGQLDHEIQRGDWKLIHGTTRIVMRSDPGRMWDELIQLSTEVWVLKH